MELWELRVSGFRVRYGVLGGFMASGFRVYIGMEFLGSFGVPGLGIGGLGV